MDFKSIKLCFKKKSIEYMEGDIDPSEFHKTFYLVLKLFRVSNETSPKWTILTPIFVIFNASTAALQLIFGIVNTMKAFDLPSLTEGGTYFIIMLYKLIIISTSITNKQNFYNLQQAIKDDFKYVCVTNPKYRKLFFDNQILTRKISVVASLYMVVVGVAMCCLMNLALIVYLLTHSTDDRPSRPLPFPIWLFNINFSESPTYEIALIYCNLCVVTQCYTYMYMTPTQIVWVRQITSKVDVIIWSIQDLLADVRPARTREETEYYTKLLKLRMREIIQMHQSMYRLIGDFADVFRKLLMVEQKLCSPLICLTAYSSAVKLDEGEIPFMLMLICVASIILVFVPNFICSFMTNKVMSIGDACWDTPFWNAVPAIRPYLILIIQRAAQPIALHGPGFEPVGIETYANKLSSAYSTFHMLRQADL